MSLVVTAAASLTTSRDGKFQWLSAVKLPQGEVYARRSDEGAITILAVHRKDLTAAFYATATRDLHAAAVTIETYRDGEYGSDHSGQAVGVWYRLETVNLADGPQCLAYDLTAARSSWGGGSAVVWITELYNYLTDAQGGVAVLRPVPGKTTRMLRACARSLLGDGYSIRSLMQLRPDRIRSASGYVAYEIGDVKLPIDDEIIVATPQVAYFFSLAGSASEWGVTAPLPHVSDATTQRYLIARSGTAIVAAPLRMAGFTSAWHSRVTEDHIWDNRVDIVGDTVRSFTTTAEALLAHCEYVHVPADAIEKARRRGRRPTGYGRFGRAIVVFGIRPRIDSGDPERGELRYREGDAVRVAINPKLVHDMLSNVPSQAPLLIATSETNPGALYMSVANWQAVVMGLQHSSEYDTGISGRDYNRQENDDAEATPRNRRRAAR